MENRVVNKNFHMADFEREAQWLEEQNRAGLKLIEAKGAHYIFEPSKGGEWSYQLDFRKKGEEEESYIKRITGFGWEFVCKYNSWYYFRKKRVSGGMDLSMFNNDDDKFVVCKEVIRKDIFKMLPLYFVIVVYNIILLFTSVFRGNAVITNITFIIGFFSAIFMAVALTMTESENKRLKKVKEESKNKELETVE